MSASSWPNHLDDGGESGLTPTRSGIGFRRPVAGAASESPSTMTTPHPPPPHQYFIDPTPRRCPSCDFELPCQPQTPAPSAFASESSSFSPTSTAAGELHLSRATSRATSRTPSRTPSPSPHLCLHCEPPKPRYWPFGMKHTSYIRNFAPSWFSVTMGTGVLPILLLNFPYSSTSLFYPAAVLCCLNLLLFIAFSIISVLRYILFPGIWSLMLHHPAQSLFLGAVPMGFATIVSGSAGLLPKSAAWGKVVEGMWWFDVALTLITTFGMCFVMIRHHGHEIKTMTAAVLLPIVPLVVCASSGGAVAGLVGVHKAVIVVVSFLMWSCGLGLALSIIALYLWRLFSHSLPPRAAIISSFLPVGPLGQGSFGILSLGLLIPASTAPSPFTNSVTPSSSIGHRAFSPGLIDEPHATTLRLLSLFTAMMLLGLGTFYLFLAFVSSLVYFPRRFSVGWWASTFPVGTYALASGAIGKEIGSEALKVVGALTSGVVALFWAVCVVGTVWRGMWKGEMLMAPCLLEKEVQLRGNLPSGSGDVQEGEEEGAIAGEQVEMTVLPCGQVVRRGSRVPEVKK